MTPASRPSGFEQLQQRMPLPIEGFTPAEGATGACSQCAVAQRATSPVAVPGRGEHPGEMVLVYPYFPSVDRMMRTAS